MQSVPCMHVHVHTYFVPSAENFRKVFQEVCHFSQHCSGQQRTGQSVLVDPPPPPPPPPLPPSLLVYHLRVGLAAGRISVPCHLIGQLAVTGDPASQGSGRACSGWWCWPLNTLFCSLLQKCLNSCMDRYMESWNIVSKAYADKLRRDSGQH